MKLIGTLGMGVIAASVLPVDAFAQYCSEPLQVHERINDLSDGRGCEPGPDIDPTGPTGPTTPTPTPSPNPTPLPRDSELAIGKASSIPQGPIDGITISANDVDAALQMLADDLGLPVTSPIAALSNQAFAALRSEVDDLEAQLSRRLVDETQGSSVEIRRVDSLVIEAKPAVVEVTQSGTEIRAFLGEFDLSLDGRVNVPVCGTVDLGARLKRVSVQSDYDLYSGNVNDSAANWLLDDLSLNGSLLQDICLEVGEIFTGRFETVLTDAINDAVNPTANALNMQEFVGVDDLIRETSDALEVVRGRTAALPGSLARLSSSRIDEAEEVLEDLTRLLSDPSFAGSGLAGSFSLTTDPDQAVTFLASHNPVEVETFNSFCQTLYKTWRQGVWPPRFVTTCATSGELSFPANTSRVDIYAGSVSSGSWTKIGSTTSGLFSISHDKNRPEIAFVSKSSVVGDLYSRPVIQDATRCLNQRSCLLLGRPPYDPAYILYE